MSFHYYIYGLPVSSSRPISLLDEHAAMPGGTDVIWTTESTGIPQPDWLAAASNESRPGKRLTFFSAETPEGTYHKLHFITEHGTLQVVISPAQARVWMIHDAAEPESNLDSYFVGTVLGCLLRLRGVVCLHASAVNIGGQAVIFLGRKKSGKSTTAAAFAKLGYKVLSDDISALHIKNDRFYIQPGYPKVRLRPKSLAVIHPGTAIEYVSVYSHRDSRYSDIGDSFWDTPLPLGAIYVMGETVEVDGIPSIEDIAGERMIHLHANTFGSFVINSEGRKQEFALLSRLATAVPVRLLRFGRNVELVNLQCEAAIRDFAAIKKPIPLYKTN
ncbi:MAG: hypothetical protein ABW019_15440 [Chitinophagaceae bacterium]